MEEARVVRFKIMNGSIRSEFAFALCNPGSESALKLEVAMMNAGWRPSYQRRGFVTFKSESGFSIGDLAAPIACSRRLCLSLGKFATREDAESKLGEVASVIQGARFHERGMQGVVDVAEHEVPAAGEWVGTVVELGESEFWAGVHRHGPGVSPDPAGDAGLVMPPESPSRAWLKLEEAVRFFGLEFTPRDVVVELGCAPGGVVLALLQRGVSVIGVDPAKMADVVLARGIGSRQEVPDEGPWFYHCRKPAALAAKRDLGPDVTWFMSDMNQAPEVVLKECARFCGMAPGIRGVLITLKLTDLNQVAEKNAWFASLGSMGFRTMRLQQLAVHHKEFALLAMR
jgi:23S rRNA (cytidine2498-2'-O)-methyltransferase